MRKTKQICVALGAMMVVGAASYAQRSIPLKVTVVSPENDRVIPNNDTFSLLFDIENLSTDENLIEGDTLFVHTPLQEANQYSMVPLTSPINAGETVRFTGGVLRNINENEEDQVIAQFCINVGGPAQMEIGGTWENPNIAEQSCATNITLEGKPGVSINSVKASAEELNLYPNPATTEVKFNVSLDKAENVIVSVKDITGREVLRHDFGTVAAGQTAPMTLNLSSLNSGMYFVELSAGERTAMGKVTISK